MYKIKKFVHYIKFSNQYFITMNYTCTLTKNESKAISDNTVLNILV